MYVNIFQPTCRPVNSVLVIVAVAAEPIAEASLVDLPYVISAFSKHSERRDRQRTERREGQVSCGRLGYSHQLPHHRRPKIWRIASCISIL